MHIQDDRPLNIIEPIWAYLSPFSAHQVKIWGETFATVEHAYHWAKFKPCMERDEIKNAKSPLACLEISREKRTKKELLVENFDKNAIMEELFRAKLTQHPEVAEVLKLTGKRGLLKEIPTDYYWGTGHDGSGKNNMGKLWMKLRDEM